ncbi:MAG: gliding motility-associated C-terminal domain-containing protein [Bacteroidia bacterium]|nr:gliding motility-associated C-terminal domain-containing protein [Bacteroidia bacterium]
MSSGNYRIRIRSNSPFVQSFMRYDSLKLRIYSKDKALPGPDTTVCFGVPVQLSAKGGSLWKWTPGAVLNDSTSRTPLFIAKKTTKFRIAISDSSGCGMPDTAFKTVYVLPAPVVVAKDTIVCRGDEFYLNATTFGGKTDSMHTFWYLDTVFLGRDTVKVKTYANARYTVIAKDGCSQANDTAGLVAKLPLAPIILTEDTAVCKGLPFKWSGSGLGYKNRKLKFTWYKNNQLFATDSLFVTPDSSSTFMLQADDACATEIAAKNVTLHVLPDPKLLAQTDSICAHNNHSINFYPTQGRAPYEFYLEGKEVFNGLKIKGDSFKRVVFEVVDACKRKAFDTLELGKIPDISITAEPNQGCIPLQTKLKAVPTKFENYWIFPNSQKVIGNSDPIIVEHKTTGNFNYKYVVKNGICADSSDLIISVYPSPTAAFQINGKNLLIGDANTRIVNYSTGANRFVWNWLNQQRYDSTITSFQLQFSDTGKFEISLIAENNYGCKDTANDFVFVHPKPIIWMPNGISLNGDGLNEKLEPGGIGIKDYKLMVINKWGEIIFNGEENEPWYPKSETLPGVYVYRCVYSNWKGLKFEENGTVLLIK